MFHSYTWHCDHLPNTTSQEGLRTEDKTKRKTLKNVKKKNDKSLRKKFFKKITKSRTTGNWSGAFAFFLSCSPSLDIYRNVVDWRKEPKQGQSTVYALSIKHWDNESKY